MSRSPPGGGAEKVFPRIFLSCLAIDAGFLYNDSNACRRAGGGQGSPGVAKVVSRLIWVQETGRSSRPTRTIVVTVVDTIYRLR